MKVRVRAKRRVRPPDRHGYAGKAEDYTLVGASLEHCEACGRMTMAANGVCQGPNFKAQQGALRIGDAHAFRLGQLASLDGALARGKQLQRDKALGQVGVRLMGDMSEVDWQKVFSAARERFIGTPALVIHVGPVSGPALCGTAKGRVVADPSTVTLLVDRYCSRCWNRWAKQVAA